MVLFTRRWGSSSQTQETSRQENSLFGSSHDECFETNDNDCVRILCIWSTHTLRLQAPPPACFKMHGWGFHQKNWWISGWKLWTLVMSNSPDIDLYWPNNLCFERIINGNVCFTVLVMNSGHHWDHLVVDHHHHRQCHSLAVNLWTIHNFGHILWLMIIYYA